MIQEKLIPYIIDSIKTYWDKPAFTDYPGPAINYSEVGRRLIWLHRVFKACGQTKGSKIALVGKNCGNWATVWLSSVTYGASVVSILINFSPEETHHIVNHCDAEVLFVSADKYQTLDEGRLRKVKYIFSLDDFSLLYSKEAPLGKKIKPYAETPDLKKLKASDMKVPDVCDNEDIATIIYTSGTTGFSRGAMIPHRSLLANLIVARENLLFKEGAKVLNFLPLAHAYACSFDLLYPVTRGNHINFMAKLPAPRVLLSAMQTLKPDVFLAVPLLIEKIYKRQVQPTLETPRIKAMLKVPLLNKVVEKKIREKLIKAFGGELRELIVGGAPMNAEVEQFMKRIKFPFTIGYGMTECGPLISYSSWSDHRFESSGRIIKFLKCKIQSPDPVNIPGEVLLKGQQVFKGYYNNEEATNEALIDGWLHTGDIGTLDEDGFIYLRGRSKNVVIGPSGENIYPELVEQKLDNLPYISESLVLERDRQLHALVYPDLEALDTAGLPVSKLPELMETNRKEVNKVLADFSRIAKIHIVNEPFQKTPTQKIKRYLYS